MKVGNNCHLQLQHTQLWSIVFHHLKKVATSVTDLKLVQLSGGFQFSIFKQMIVNEDGKKEDLARLHPLCVHLQTWRMSGYGSSILMFKNGRMLTEIYHPNWTMSYSSHAFHKSTVHLHTSAVSKLTAGSFQPWRQKAAAAWSSVSPITQLLQPVDWCWWARKCWQ